MRGAMRGALYLRRGTTRRTWRAVLALAVLGGLLGAIALAALAAARRTGTAYDRHLTASRAADAQVNVPGLLPGQPALRPSGLISALPAVESAATYIGVSCLPVVNGKVRPSFLTNGVNASLGEYWSLDRLTVLAGRMPPASATGQIILSPKVAALFGVGVGGTVTYRFDNAFNENGPHLAPKTAPRTRSFRVAAIVEVPPVLVDQAEVGEGAILPPGASRQLEGFYQYAWVSVRLHGGAAGLGALRAQLGRLGARLGDEVGRALHRPPVHFTFTIQRNDVVRSQVQRALAPQVVALSLFGGVAGLALLVLAGQGLAGLTSRSAAALPAARAIGATRAQTALAVALPGAAAVAGTLVLAVAGAVALSPLAPVGPVRRYDPDVGFHADPLVLGAGAAVAAAGLAVLLAVAARRATRPPRETAGPRPPRTATAAVTAGLPVPAVLGSRNAVRSGAGDSAPAWVSLAGSVAAVTAVAATAVFGASLAQLVSHPRQYGWNWDVLLQAEGGYGNFEPVPRLERIVAAQPAVAAWSTFGFSQLPADGQLIPVAGVHRWRGDIMPPTIAGRPLAASGEIELGSVTMSELGLRLGDTVAIGLPGHVLHLRLVGTVTFPSFGVEGAEHVSLGRGALLTEDDLFRAAAVNFKDLVLGSPAASTLPSALAIDVVPTTSPARRAAMVARLIAARPDRTPGGTYALDRPLAAEMTNASGMSGQPLALALGLAVAAVLSLALTVLASVRRQRRELALLKTLGLSRGQVRAIVAWQTTVTLAIAVVAGIPLGVAAGRWAWRAFAGSLGVDPATAVPALALIAGAAALLAAGNLLTAVPGAIAARTAPAAVLRAD